MFLSHHSTPFGKRAESFLPVYYERVAQKKDFSGYVENTQQYMPSDKKDGAKLPSSFHLLDKSVFVREPGKVGFNLISADYINSIDHLPELTHLISKGGEWLVVTLGKAA